MRCSPITLLLGVFILMSSLAFAQRDAYSPSKRVIKSYHLGPWAPNVNNQEAQNDYAPRDMSCDTLVVAEDGSKFYNPPPCQYCIQCNYQQWCPYCGYCPLYDESDIIDEYDRHATWPSKRSDSWMREWNY
jgi:hypothetical protein